MRGRQNRDEGVGGGDLRVSVHGMESMGSVRGWNNPSVVGLMKSFVDKGMMKTSMNPVDQTIRENKK
jgi:hypothetical protein